VDKKLFKRLVESTGQMDEIVRGVRVPSRELYVYATKMKETGAITGFRDVCTPRGIARKVESRPGRRSRS
jgi:hypothetical protein